MRWPFVFLFLLSSSSAWAGYFEIGSSYNYRESHIDEDNRTISRSITGSFSYYFWEQSAIELSYTEGTTDIRLEEVKVNVKFQIYGADLILSFGDKESWFKPYVKGGAIYQVKSTRTQYSEIDKTVKSSGTSPSAGVGFRLMLTQNFVFRAGADAWASSSSDTTTYDLVGRAGVSWMF
ncbi:MAG: outer membrane beta-barrel protein [Bdellovibrionales bacterium]|nr:outer membrane beta-barrel protein [Bdellovibrionales bacterium]